MDSERDFKLVACFHFGLADPTTTSVSSPVFQQSSAAFDANISRLRSISSLPLFYTAFAIGLQRIVDQAEISVRNTLSRDPLTASQVDQLNTMVRKLHSELTDREEQLSKENPGEYAAYVTRQITEAYNYIMPVSMSPGPQIVQGQDSLMSSMIISCWSAIETLCGDLWQAAINAHPALLSELKGKANRIKQSGNVASAEGAAGEKSVPLNWLQRYGFNLSDHMGEMLRATGKVKFDSLDAIRSAYSQAFSDDSADVDKALGSDDLDRLSVMRNVLVHRSGIADGEYIKRARGLKLPCPAEGQPILLDGEIVVSILMPTIKRGQELIKAVDNWLVAHPEKK